MPEGHTVHRLARQHRATFGGRQVFADSPQGRFSAGAALISGQVMSAAEAYGKHLFLGFAPGPRHRPRHWLHVHLGLYGKWRFGDGAPPEPRGAVRVRLVDDEHWAELRGPTACDVLTPAEQAAIVARLGPDPLRADAEPALAAARVGRSRTGIGALLMQQDVVAGVGNVYRAEVLFRAGLDPYRPGAALGEGVWDGIWADLVVLLADGVRRGSIVTTRPEDRSRARGAVRREDAHYVYRRTGLPCRICATPVLAEPLVGRTLYRCPTCQT
ncbi:MAG: DNA-formamidopyrimidine glycosylase family protein [Kineosporiaceae bacterium]